MGCMPHETFFATMSATLPVIFIGIVVEAGLLITRYDAVERRLDRQATGTNRGIQFVRRRAVVAELTLFFAGMMFAFGELGAVEMLRNPRSDDHNFVNVVYASTYALVVIIVAIPL